MGDPLPRWEPGMVPIRGANPEAIRFNAEPKPDPERLAKALARGAPPEESLPPVAEKSVFAKAVSSLQSLFSTYVSAPLQRLVHREIPLVKNPVTLAGLAVSIKETTTKYATIAVRAPLISLGKLLLTTGIVNEEKVLQKAREKARAKASAKDENLYQL